MKQSDKKLLELFQKYTDFLAEGNESILDEILQRKFNDMMHTRFVRVVRTAQSEKYFIFLHEDEIGNLERIGILDIHFLEDNEVDLTLSISDEVSREDTHLFLGLINFELLSPTYEIRNADIVQGFIANPSFNEDEDDCDGDCENCPNPCDEEE